MVRALIPGEQPRGSGAELAKLAQVLMRARANRITKAEAAEASNASDRIVRICTKAAVGAGTTGTTDLPTGSLDYRTITEAFLDSLRSRSVFYALLADGLVPVPLRARVGLLTANATGWIVGQGKPIPVSAIGLSRQTLEPVKAAALLVVTNELLNASGPAALALINRELSAAVAEAVDLQFLSMITDTSTQEIASSGTDATAVKVDMLALLNAVHSVAGGRIVLAGGAAAANAATVMDERNQMSPEGGLFFGMPFVVSKAVAAGSIVAIDGSGVIGDSDGIVLDASAQADIEMADDPTNDSSVPTAAQMTSMWETDSTALKAVAFFAAERKRTDAVAVLTEVAWGSVSSP